MAISSSTLASCYTGSGGVECTNSPDAAIVSALSDMTQAVEATCAPADLTTLLLPSDMMDLGDLLEGQCLQPLTTLASRAYGGPQAQALSDNVGDDACFTTAFTEASRFLESAADAFSTCATDGDCSDVTAEIDSLEASAVAAIAGSCPAAQLQSNVGLTIERLLERTRNDAECQASRLYPDQVEGLTCAPRNTVDAIQVWEYPGGVPTEVFANQTSDGTPSPTTQHAPERGQFVQVELDAETTGATCGDGSNYRFWFQLAPEGEPLDRVVVFAPGGGACTNVLSQDCSSQVAGALGLSSSTSLLNSQGSGIGSQGGSSSLTDFLEPRNPYQNYTKLRLTYCTQDIYAGGEGGSQDVTVTIGGDSVDFTIQRTGGHNIRVASEYLGDVLIAAMSAEGDSYDPASVEAVIAGSSAGGFFTTFNYHFFLDELGWTQSTMVHEWGLG
ncbi:MAG: pectin acetylesterase-family hydrolase, partial [Pseudomonadota bacterium]